MDGELVKRLLALNREFYSEFAIGFSKTRSSEGVNLKPIMPYLSHGIKALDIGCGNGRLAERLDREGYELTYVGIDATAELIEIAGAAEEDSARNLCGVSSGGRHDARVDVAAAGPLRV